jgi:diguanylate cyclase (GGDEF)-like protein/PAS domain S-box-containing protein
MKPTAAMRRSRLRSERQAVRKAHGDKHAADLRQAGLDLVRLAALICGMPVAYLSRFEGRQHRILASTGAVIPRPHLHAEKCMQILSSRRNLPFVEEMGESVDSGGAGPNEEETVLVGVPLQGYEGMLLGTLCLMGPRDTALSTAQKEALLALGRQACAHLEAQERILHLQDRIECFEACLDSGPAAVSIKDDKGAYLYANASFLSLAGVKSDDIIGKTDMDLWPPDMAARLLDKDRKARQAGTSYSEAELMSRPDGICRYWQVHRFVMQGRPALLASVGFDITDWKANEQQLMASQELLKRSLENLEVLSVTDGLTGLHNRRAFEEKLKEEFERARRYKLPLSLLMLDADRFKEFNDACGHPAGDHLLKEIALILKQNARANDIVARYGGDEFVVILPNTESKVAFHLAERLRRAAKVLCHSDQPVTISVGVSALKATMLDPHGLLVAADKALYDAKRKGRNRVSHTVDLHA